MNKFMIIGIIGAVGGMVVGIAISVVIGQCFLFISFEGDLSPLI